MRRGLIISVVVGVLLLAVLAAAVVWAATPHVSATGPDRTINDDPAEVWARFDLPTGATLSDATVIAEIDGNRLRDGVTVTGTGVLLEAAGLADGPHTARVEVDGVGPLGLGTVAAWEFEVDTTPPPLRVTRPGADILRSTDRNLSITVRTEAGAAVIVTGGRQPVRATASEDGRAQLELALHGGRQSLTISSTDEAGNRSTIRRVADIDAAAPRVNVAGGTTIVTSTPTIEFSVADRNPVAIGDVRLNGEVLDAAISGTDAAPADLEDAPGIDCDTAPDGNAEPACPNFLSGAISGSVIATEPLYEGHHTLEVDVRDSFGNARTWKQQLQIDSSEVLGEAAGLGQGARGDDVRELQQRLAELDHFDAEAAGSEWASRTYGPETAAAVRSAQSAAGVTADGVAGKDTLAGLIYRVEISRTSNTLTLYRLGEVAKTYAVSTGSPQYPTPAGEFRVTNMQANPTWNPPDSDWAKDAKPIPPGPGNPLGTRWMGLDAPAIGIHGTPDPASLGYSRSHGCIRMAIPEAEELFDIIGVGTPVKIV